MADQFMLLIEQRRCAVVVISDAGEVSTRWVDLEAGSAEMSRGRMVREALEALDYDGRPVLMALPSSRCLGAAIPVQGLERTGRRRALQYRLEEQLPISAEDFVADFADRGADGTVLAVCTELASVEQEVADLEEAGVPVRSIVPLALLVAGRAVAARPAVGVVVAGSVSSGFDVIELERAVPCRWWWFAEDGPELADCLSAMVPAPGDAVWGATGQVMERLRRDREAEGIGGIEDLGVDDIEAAAVQAAAVLGERSVPWIDLRCDRLAAADRLDRYRRPLGALFVAAAVFTLGVIGVFHWRAMAYEAEASRLRAMQVEVFRQTLPDQRRVPANIRGRLESEYRRVLGLGGGEGGGSGDATDDQACSALDQLADILEHLPGDIRFRILDLDIRPDMVRIDGQARSHAEAERLAVALRDAGTFAVDPPKTSALRDGGVGFMFTARRAEAGGLARGGAS